MFLVDLMKNHGDIKRYQNIKLPDFVFLTGFINMIVLGFINADIEGTDVFRIYGKRSEKIISREISLFYIIIIAVA